MNKNLTQECSMNAEILQRFLLYLLFSFSPLVALLIKLKFILISMLMMLFSSLNVIGRLLCCSSLSWLLESGLLETVSCSQKGSVTFSVVKIQLVLFDRSNNSGTVNVKMNRSLFDEKPSLRMLGFSISSKLDWVLLLSLLLNCF